MTAGASEVNAVKLTINGREVEAVAGQTILEASRAVGIDIPTLCHDPRLEPYGACRLCLVEVEGARGPMASCGTKISEGMKVETHSEKIVKLRKFILELLLTNHPLDCPVCEAAGDCRLQDYAYEYEVDMVPWGWRAPEPDSPGEHPNVAHFGARCILCGRCVRICREVMSIGCWGYLNRGYESEVDTPYRRPLQEVGCVSCGQCVSTCPVGSVTSQRAATGARQWQTEKARTTCSYCSNGCEIVGHGYNGRVVRVTSALERGLNQGNLCVKGRFGQSFANSTERLLKPLVRNSAGQLEESTWEDALQRIVEAASKTKAAGESLAVVCGTKVTNEAAYLAKKLANEVFESSLVVSGDQSDKTAVAQALGAALGSSAAMGSRQDLDKVGVILVVGSNLTESNPVLAINVIHEIRKGKTVIVIDPRTTELARRATIHLAVKPGGDLAALRGIMAHVIGAQLEDVNFISGRTEGFEALKKSLAGVSVDAEAAAAGVDAADLREAAESIGQASGAGILFGSGVTSAPNAVEVIEAIADVALLTGNVGTPGNVLIPLVSGANSQGLADLGVDGSMQQVLQGIEAGKVKFAYVISDDPAMGVPGQTRVREDLAKLDFLVVEDSFLSDTAALADVVLPAAVSTEDEGSYTNTEGYVQRVRPVVPTKEQSVPDWMVPMEIAKRMGSVWTYSGPADVMAEIAGEVEGYSEISYASLEQGGAFRSQPAFGTGVFQAVASGSAPVDAPAERPFVLITGSVLEHHETGVRSRRSDGLTKLNAAAAAEINPADAERLGIADGARVRLTGALGESIELAADVAALIPAGLVFVPGFDPACPVTKLLSADNEALPGVSIEAV